MTIEKILAEIDRETTALGLPAPGPVEREVMAEVEASMTASLAASYRTADVDPYTGIAFEEAE